MYSWIFVSSRKPATEVIHTPVWRRELWPFLGKNGRCTDRYRVGSWASPRGLLWPIVDHPRALTKLYAHPRSTKCLVYRVKSVTRGALHPHKWPLPHLNCRNGTWCTWMSTGTPRWLATIIANIILAKECLCQEILDVGGVTTCPETNEFEKIPDNQWS